MTSIDNYRSFVQYARDILTVIIQDVSSLKGPALLRSQSVACLSDQSRINSLTSGDYKTINRFMNNALQHLSQNSKLTAETTKHATAIVAMTNMMTLYHDKMHDDQWSYIADMYTNDDADALERENQKLSQQFKPGLFV